MTEPASPASPDEPPRAPGAATPLHWWLDPLVLVVAIVAIGVVIAALHHPRIGMYVVCAGVAGGAVLRLVLSPVRAGSLVVRRRRFDVVILLSLALGIGIMAAVTPFPAS
jgi:Protein of unknown function (DUF3017)